MLNRTLSAITAIVIGTSGLSATEVISLDKEGNTKKDINVIATSNEVIYNNNGVYGDPYSISEPQRVDPAPRVATQQPTSAQIMQPAKPSNGYGDTIVYASGVKNYYEIGEPIQIKLKLKRRAYIYFWTVGSSGKSYRILPNSLESYNDYKANVNYVVPEHSATAKYDFVSDRAGVEQIYVVATNKKINTSKLRSIFSQKSVSQNSMREFITKDIHAVAREQNLKYDIASFQIQVR